MSEKSLNEVFLCNVSPAVCQIGQAYDTTYLPNLLRKDQGNKINLFSILYVRKLRLREATETHNYGQKPKKVSKAGPV